MIVLSLGLDWGHARTPDETGRGRRWIFAVKAHRRVRRLLEMSERARFVPNLGQSKFEKL
jgi:hypothetical protein